MLKNKIISISTSSPLESYFHKSITSVSLVVCKNIDDAIKKMVFLDAHPVNPNKTADAIYYIKSINGFVFSHHDYLFPIFRYMQHAGMLPKEGITLFNPDAHSDFYYAPEFGDSQHFDRWGKIQTIDWTDSPLEFARKNLKHSRDNIGIASFLYPLLWDKSITTYIWRDYKSLALFGRLASKILHSSCQAEPVNFYYSNKAGHYFPPFYKDAPHLQLNPKKTIEMSYLNANTATFEAFSGWLKQLTEPIVHTIDVDFLFKGVPYKGFQDKYAEGFKQDMSFISKNPQLYPLATLIATSPTFSNPKEAERGVRFVLEQYRFLEQ